MIFFTPLPPNAFRYLEPSSTKLWHNTGARKLTTDCTDCTPNADVREVDDKQYHTGDPDSPDDYDANGSD
jgi:hypothetical protein